MTKRFRLLGLAVLLHDSGRPPLEARGSWHLANLDATATVDTGTRRVSVSGVITLELRGGSSQNVTLVLGQGGVAFDSASISAPASVAWSSARDSVRIQLSSPAQDGDQIRVSFGSHTRGDVGRYVVVRPEGVIASGLGLWYPVVAWERGGGPDPRVAGTLRITVPRSWRTLSNGFLTDSSLAGEQRTETWRSAQPLVRSLIAAEYQTHWARVGRTPVAVHLLPRHAGRAAEYAEAIPRMVDVLTRYFGPYPFESFGIAEVPRSVAPPGFGGRGEAGYFVAHTDALEGTGVNVQLFAHELAHMWFPYAVDSRPPGDDMMDEAIADYALAVYLEATEGRARARRQLIDGHPEFSMRGYFHLLRIGADEPLMADYSTFVARAKGPLVYDMLRRRVGDSVFFATWRELVRRHGATGASLWDLRRLFVEAAPADTGLPAFLSEWLDRAGAPVIESTWTQRGGTVSLRIRQQGNVYRLPLTIRLYSATDSVDRNVNVTRADQRFALRVRGRIRRVELDPAHEVLMWRPAFGPPPNRPGSWSASRWQRWFADDLQWLMSKYEVRRTHVVRSNAGAIVTDTSYAAPPAEAGPSASRSSQLRAELAKLIETNTSMPDSLPVSKWVEMAGGIALIVAYPRRGDGVAILAEGGWGGRQLTVLAAQRIGVRLGWPGVRRMGT